MAVNHHQQSTAFLLIFGLFFTYITLSSKIRPDHENFFPAYYCCSNTRNTHLNYPRHNLFYSCTIRNPYLIRQSTAFAFIQPTYFLEITTGHRRPPKQNLCGKPKQHISRSDVLPVIHTIPSKHSMVNRMKEQDLVMIYFKTTDDVDEALSRQPSWTDGMTSHLHGIPVDVSIVPAISSTSTDRLHTATAVS